MCKILKDIGINKEKEICQPQKEYIERIYMVVKYIVLMHIPQIILTYFIHTFYMNLDKNNELLRLLDP